MHGVTGRYSKRILPQHGRGDVKALAFGAARTYLAAWLANSSANSLANSSAT
jgi:hypothetical protein